MGAGKVPIVWNKYQLASHRYQQFSRSEKLEFPLRLRGSWFGLLGSSQRKRDLKFAQLERQPAKPECACQLLQSLSVSLSMFWQPCLRQTWRHPHSLWRYALDTPLS